MAFKIDEVLITRLHLRADYPLPSGNGADSCSQSSSRRALSLDVVELVGGATLRCTLTRQLRCRVVWDRGSSDTFTFIYLASGRNRDALVEVSHPLVLKAHLIVDGKTNANAEECSDFISVTKGNISVDSNTRVGSKSV